MPQSTEIPFQLETTAPPAQIEDRVAAGARRRGLDENLARAIAKNESGFGRNAGVSKKNAEGVMQMIPSTSQAMGVKNPFDWEQNVEGGLDYLAQLHKKYGGDPEKIIRAYHAGPGNVDNPQWKPGPENQSYTAKVLKDRETFAKTPADSSGASSDIPFEMEPAPHRYTPAEVKAHFANFGPLQGAKEQQEELTRGFLPSLGQQLTGPFKFMVDPRVWKGEYDPLEGLQEAGLSTLLKARTGNWPGAVGDIAGMLALGRIGPRTASKARLGPAPELAPPPVRPRIALPAEPGTVGEVATVRPPVQAPSLSRTGKAVKLGGQLGKALTPPFLHPFIEPIVEALGGKEVPVAPRASSVSPTWTPGPPPPSPKPSGITPTWVPGKPEPVPVPKSTGVSPTWSRQGTVTNAPPTPLGETAAIPTLDEVAQSLAGKPYSKLDAAMQKKALDTRSGIVRATPPQVTAPAEHPNPRHEAGLTKLHEAASAKDAAMAKRFLDRNLTPEQVDAMSEAELSQELKAAGFRKFRGSHLSRSFEEGKADIVKAMRKK